MKGWYFLAEDSEPVGPFPSKVLADTASELKGMSPRAWEGVLKFLAMDEKLQHGLDSRIEGKHGAIVISTYDTWDPSTASVTKMYRALSVRHNKFADGGTQDQAVKKLNDVLDKLAGDERVKFAFDRSSVRTFDADGRLHVELTNISKANVCGYFGREIPDYESLGLDANKKYMLLRDPKELAKGAATFNGIQVLQRHTAINAKDPQQWEVIGATGTDAVFEEPYLKNSLVIWTKTAIDDVENEVKKELSSAYRYRADMTPGTYEGEHYDGVMRDIIGNHVALVKEGRAGPDVVVGDSKPEETVMTTKLLTRKAAVAQGALMGYLRPKLAQDAQIDLTPVVADITQANFSAKKPEILNRVRQATAGKLAKDANLDDMHSFVDSLEKEKPHEAPEGKDDSALENNSGVPKEAHEFLKSKLSEDDKRTFDSLCAAGKASGMDSEEETKKKEAEAKAKSEEADKKKGEDKRAMDAAIESRLAAERQRTKQAREAEKDVRAYVGELAIAYDSAEEVYRAALGMMKVQVEGIDTLTAPALKAILKGQPVPNKSSHRDSTVAMDAAATKSYEETYGTSRIAHL